MAHTVADSLWEASSMVNISVSSRSLAAARSVDPDVSPAAVHAAVEAALAEQMRQLGRGRVQRAERPSRQD
ncbi:hypothetical protein [Pseudonocardia sp. GCM10023141]|uniref:hypothetical protein n=1 Tax=Pseudonocardia sp. GCM10023141 TaxID=3252653 RepID=UPI003619F154